MQDLGDRDERSLHGITFDPKRANWKARIHFAGKEHYIGRYNLALDAALAYDQAARMVNEVQDDGNTQPKPRRRPLNFPNQRHYDEDLHGRLQQLLSIAAPGPASRASTDNGDMSPSGSESPPPEPTTARTAAAAAARAAAAAAAGGEFRSRRAAERVEGASSHANALATAAAVADALSGRRLTHGSVSPLQHSGSPGSSQQQQQQHPQHRPASAPDSSPQYADRKRAAEQPVEQHHLEQQRQQQQVSPAKRSAPSVLSLQRSSSAPAVPASEPAPTGAAAAGTGLSAHTMGLPWELDAAATAAAAGVYGHNLYPAFPSAAAAGPAAAAGEGDYYMSGGKNGPAAAAAAGSFGGQGQRMPGYAPTDGMQPSSHMCPDGAYPPAVTAGFDFGHLVLAPHSMGRSFVPVTPHTVGCAGPDSLLPLLPQHMQHPQQQQQQQQQRLQQEAELFEQQYRQQYSQQDRQHHRHPGEQHMIHHLQQQQFYQLHHWQHQDKQQQQQQQLATAVPEQAAHSYHCSYAGQQHDVRHIDQDNFGIADGFADLMDLVGSEGAAAAATTTAAAAAAGGGHLQQQQQQQQHSKQPGHHRSASMPVTGTDGNTPAGRTTDPSHRQQQQQYGAEAPVLQRPALLPFPAVATCSHMQPDDMLQPSMRGTHLQPPSLLPLPDCLPSQTPAAAATAAAAAANAAAAAASAAAAAAAAAAGGGGGVGSGGGGGSAGGSNDGSCAAAAAAAAASGGGHHGVGLLAGVTSRVQLLQVTNSCLHKLLDMRLAALMASDQVNTLPRLQEYLQMERQQQQQQGGDGAGPSSAPGGAAAPSSAAAAAGNSTVLAVLDCFLQLMCEAVDEQGLAPPSERAYVLGVLNQLQQGLSGLQRVTACAVGEPAGEASSAWACLRQWLTGNLGLPAQAAIHPVVGRLVDRLY